ncbi:hypothetical protein GIB67_010277 [Kingdonia uniflora]|uniref:ATP-dependent DNA helicase n=1 Tax=Kingdonia uniflora TaxID=39325 RepID=A0A7J7NAY8_9MAGN|nr:hypothetical protein GIB67_010277 [Kingdonia uniflora]
MRSDNQPFSGITVVLGGDFCQILHVVPKGAREQIVAASLRQSSLWGSVRVLTLFENMRLDYSTPTNAQFANFQMEIGSNPLKIVQLPSIIHNCETVQDLILYVYPNLNISCEREQCFLTERIILSARNDDVSAINDDTLNMFLGEPIVYLAADKFEEHEISLTPSTIKMPFEIMR